MKREIIRRGTICAPSFQLVPPPGILLPRPAPITRRTPPKPAALAFSAFAALGLASILHLEIPREFPPLRAENARGMAVQRSPNLFYQMSGTLMLFDCARVLEQLVASGGAEGGSGGGIPPRRRFRFSSFFCPERVEGWALWGFVPTSLARRVRLAVLCSVAITFSTHDIAAKFWQ